MNLTGMDAPAVAREVGKRPRRWVGPSVAGLAGRQVEHDWPVFAGAPARTGAQGTPGLQ